MTNVAPSPPAPCRYCPWLALAAGAVMLLRLALSVGVFSPAIDESSHVGAAVSMIEAHKLIAPGSHPPLARLVAAIPLWLDGARLEDCRGQTAVGTEDLGYELGTQVLYRNPKTFRTLLVHARLAMLIFPTMALLYLYLLGRLLSGPAVAALAVVFFSFDPTLLGHGFWVGNDVAGCAGFLAATYHGLRWIDRPNWVSSSILGLALGLAISAKFSCLLAIPAIVLLALLRCLPWRKIWLQLPAIAAIAFVSLWATYFFNVGPLSDQAGLNAPAQQGSAANSESQAMRQQWQRLPRWVRQTPIPMPSFFLAVARLAAHNRFGHGAYLNGQISPRGWWYYFPEILAVKSPIGFLAALLCALGVAIFRRQWRDGPTLAIVLPAAIFLIAAMAGNIDIGIRYILPAIPFLYLFTVIQLARPRWIWLLALLMVCSAVETAVIHPDYLSYFNFAVGGPANGQRFALDSNLDWNQDVFRLADWIHTRGHDRTYAIRLSGERNEPLLAALGLDPESLQASPRGRLLFISKNAQLIDGQFPWLSRHEPIAHIGYSIDVYDLTPTGPADER